MKKNTSGSRYGSGQGHCQVCDIWIDHKGCHMKDGTPAKKDQMGWICNCCNFRVRQKPRGKRSKEILKAEQEKRANQIIDPGQNTNNKNSLIFRTLQIIKNNHKGIYFEDLRKNLGISNYDVNDVVTNLIKFRTISKKEIQYDGKILDVLFEFKQDLQQTTNTQNDISDVDKEQIQFNQIFTEQELQTQFRVGNSGGIRTSMKAEVILLISSASSRWGNYENKIGANKEFIYYTGQGQGHQTIKGNNKTVTQSKERGYTILYFEKPEPGKYVYKFPLEYVSYSKEEQENQAKMKRDVILFKLKILK